MLLFWDIYSKELWKDWISIDLDLNNLLSNEVVCAIVLLVVIAVFSTIYLTRKETFCPHVVFHKPGFQSNRSSSTSLTEMSIFITYVVLWIYMVYIPLSETTKIQILSSISMNSVLFAVFNIATTYLLILCFVLLVGCALNFIIYSVVIVPSGTAVWFFVTYPTPVTAFICVAVLLMTLVLHRLFLQYTMRTANAFKTSQSVILQNFVPIFKMLLVTTAIFSLKLFVMYCFLKTFQRYSLSNLVLLMLAFSWSLTIYHYFNKTFMSSAIYLGLEGKEDKKSIFYRSLSASMSSFCTICHAALIPSMLRIIHSIVEKLYKFAKSSEYPLIFYLVGSVLYMVKIVVEAIVFLFEFFNESLISYIGIYGGRYNTDTASKVMEILWKSPAYQVLNIPVVKHALSTWVTMLLLTLLAVANEYLVAPLLGISWFSMPENLDTLVLSPTMVVFGFCAFIIYSFIQCIDSAVSAKICYDCDKENPDGVEIGGNKRRPRQ